MGLRRLLLALLLAACARPPEVDTWRPIEQVQVVYYFTTWCPSCEKTTPEIVEAYHRLDGYEKVVFVGMIGDPPGTDYIERHGIAFPVLGGNSPYNVVPVVELGVLRGGSWRIAEVVIGYIQSDALVRKVVNLVGGTYAEVDLGRRTGLIGWGWGLSELAHDRIADRGVAR